jgi:hypothetical protein
MRIPQVLVLAGFASVVGLATLAAEAPTPFDVASKMEQVNVATPEGRAFDAAFGKQFSEKHVNTMVRCTMSVTDTDLASFDLLVKLAVDGKVQETLVRPATKVATCLQEAVAKDTFKAPAHSGYWVRVEMSLKP